jgi:hypothetical protein
MIKKQLIEVMHNDIQDWKNEKNETTWKQSEKILGKKSDN